MTKSDEGAVPKDVRPTLAVLLVTHNRRDTTLRAVEALKGCSSFALEVVVFDDASDDGTPEAIKECWPTATIIGGQGDAFWNGGLHRVWSAALELDPDAYLWLNDDVVLDKDALEKLRTEWDTQLASGSADFVLVGATRDAAGQMTYGGMLATRTPVSLRLELAPVCESIASVDTFNGNIVLVPRAVVERIGINDQNYFHNLGDVDYGLRAREAGVKILQLPGTLGVCDSNDAKKLRGYGSPQLSVFEQWKKVATHHGLPPRSWLHFTRRHSGRWWPVHFLLPYRHLLKFWRVGGRNSGKVS